MAQNGSTSPQWHHTTCGHWRGRLKSTHGQMMVEKNALFIIGSYKQAFSRSDILGFGFGLPANRTIYFGCLPSTHWQKLSHASSDQRSYVTVRTRLSVKLELANLTLYPQWSLSRRHKTIEHWHCIDVYYWLIAGQCKGANADDSVSNDSCDDIRQRHSLCWKGDIYIHTNR